MPSAAEEKRRKRLEAWRKRQAANKGSGTSGKASLNSFVPPKAKKKPISLSLSSSSMKKKRKRDTKDRLAESKRLNSLNLLGDDDDDSAQEEISKKKKKAGDLDAIMNELEQGDEKSSLMKSSRWDKRSEAPSFFKIPPPPSPSPSVVNDALDQFMEKLDSGALGSVITQHKESEYSMQINLSGTMQKKDPSMKTFNKNKMTITPEELANSHTRKISNSSRSLSTASSRSDSNQIFTASDWESDANTTNNPLNESEAETEEEDDEEEHKNFIAALKNLPAANGTSTTNPVLPSAQAIFKSKLMNLAPQQFQLASEVKDEKQRREETLAKLQEEAEKARKIADDTPSIGRIFNDFDSGVMEEAERTLDVLNSEPDALQVLAELNKKKELKAVDHSKIDYMNIRKNLYIVPRTLSNLTSDDIAARRAKLKVKVRGKGCPSPISTFREGGLSERILSMLSKQKIETPFPVQAQCIPAIMGGRDVIGIAKTGSGKTLAYLLPMLRHILDQPDLEPHESGPIGLILAPARELAAQIHSVCKSFAKQLGIK